MPAGRIARRSAILVAAEKLLSHYGVTKTTVADIAREAQVSVGSVYLEFASKEEILASLAAEAQGQLLRSMEGARESAGGFAEQLHALLLTRSRYLQRFAAKGQHSSEIMHSSCPAVAQVKRQYRQRQLELFSLLIEEAQRQGEFSPADPASTADLVLRICDALLPGCSEKVSPSRLRNNLDSVCQLILNGLRVR